MRISWPMRPATSAGRFTWKRWKTTGKMLNRTKVKSTRRKQLSPGRGQPPRQVKTALPRRKRTPRLTRGVQSCCAGKDSPPGAAVPHDSRSTKHNEQRKVCGPAALGLGLDTIKLRVHQRRNRFNLITDWAISDLRRSAGGRHFHAALDREPPFPGSW